MKTLTIPKRFGYPTLDITVNRIEYTVKSGEEITLEDHVAEAIENAIALAPKLVVPRSRFAQLAEGSITEITAEDLEGISNIHNYTFYNKPKLKKVTIPNCIETIGKSVFEWCSNLEAVYLPEIPPTLANTIAFNEVKATCTFYCKTQESLEAYKAATNWSTLTGTYSFVVE